jgi:hypothetical protein
MTLLVVSVVLSPSKARGDMYQVAKPMPYGDDIHMASLNPYPDIKISTIASDPPGQCAWINTGLDNFKKVNPMDGSGDSKAGWKFTWAGAAVEAKVEAGIKILDYYPYVVTPPKAKTASGVDLPAKNPGELGGAVINLQYTAQKDVPIKNLHWIQALTGTLWGNPTGGGTPILDTGPAYKSQSTITPFYDVNDDGTPYPYAGTYGAGNAFFLDRTIVPEFDSYFTNQEYESNPVASVQFQVILAGDNVTTDDKGVTQHDVTLYGGEWWGFTYEAIETPEPSTFLLITVGGSGLLFFRSIRRRRRAAEP